MRAAARGVRGVPVGGADVKAERRRAPGDRDGLAERDGNVDGGALDVRAAWARRGDRHDAGRHGVYCDVPEVARRAAGRQRQVGRVSGRVGDHGAVQGQGAGAGVRHGALAVAGPHQVVE